MAKVGGCGGGGGGIACWRRASTTRRTRTRGCESKVSAPTTRISRQYRGKGARRTCKCLLHVDALARARLHEAAAARARPLEALARAHAPLLLEVALVAADEQLGRGAAGVLARLGLHADQVHEVGELLVQRGRRRDVVDEQEGVGVARVARLQRAVLLLPGRVGEGEQVRPPVDGARDRVGVLDGGVVPAGARRGRVSAAHGATTRVATAGAPQGRAYSWVHWLRTRRNVMDDLPVCGTQSRLPREQRGGPCIARTAASIATESDVNAIHRRERVARRAQCLGVAPGFATASQCAHATELSACTLGSVARKCSSVTASTTPGALTPG